MIWSLANKCQLLVLYARKYRVVAGAPMELYLLKQKRLAKYPGEIWIKSASTKFIAPKQPVKVQPVRPPPPVSVDGIAAEFFNDITVATKHNQHSIGAAAENRGGVYAAHNSLGKAHIWFTFCPDDTKSFKILWYPLSAPEQSTIYKDQIPDGIIRLETLANRPGTGALNFERCLNITIEYLVGWDCEANAPLKHRGVWGIPSGHLRIVEEQFRLTLHSHHLIWLHGHQ